MIFHAILDETKILETPLTAINKLNDECLFKLENNQLNIQMIDKAHICYIHCIIPFEAFLDSKLTEDTEFGINPHDILEVLNKCRKDEYLDLKLTENNKIHCTIHNTKNNLTKEYSIVTFNCDTQPQTMPDIEYPLEIVMDTNQFKQNIQDASYGKQEKLILQTLCNDLIFTTLNQFENGKVTYPLTEHVEEALAIYSLENVNILLTCAKFSNKISIQFGNDMPLTLKLTEPETTAVLTTILAPRIEEI